MLAACQGFRSIIGCAHECCCDSQPELSVCSVMHALTPLCACSGSNRDSVEPAMLEVGSCSLLWRCIPSHNLYATMQGSNKNKPACICASLCQVQVALLATHFACHVLWHQSINQHFCKGHAIGWSAVLLRFHVCMQQLKHQCHLHT